MIGLDNLPVSKLKGIGSAVAEKLSRLQIHQVQDLLFHLPVRYQDRTRVVPIGALGFGEEAVVCGKIVGCEVAQGRRRSLLCRIRDDSGTLVLRFFHFTAAQKTQLENADLIRCFGELRRGSTGAEMFHPEYRLPGMDTQPTTEDKLTPIYPLTEGITQGKLRYYISQALALLNHESLPEYLPDNLQQGRHFPPLEAAIRYLHQPPTDANMEQLQQGQHPAQQRLAFEELLAHQLSLLDKKNQARLEQAPIIPQPGNLYRRLLESLPFRPTDAQYRVVREILTDMGSGHPMLRLVQGDVGSGKTLVAALAGACVLDKGLQVAIMAPTEILAEQHFINFQNWFAPLDIEVARLVGKLKGKARAQQLECIADGSALLVTGTHALFQESVRFNQLALVIIDEQHRFGVHQRMALREKGLHDRLQPHQLIMTATPIPRTLAMSAYADLDCSVIDELPPGRTPITTIAVSDQRRQEVIDRIRAACHQKQQVYWVCTLVEESEALQCQAAEETARMLMEQLPELQVGLVHGRLKPREKAGIMEAFKQGELQLLVATTVIEVGVDVPNASLMIIENPERLGLAQLHQLRGRVGRGSTASYCVLLYKTPLGQQGKARLGILRETSDGFKIAEKDLELRGPGELLGTRQTGLLEFKVADLQRDKSLLQEIQKAALLIYQHHREQIPFLLARWLPKQNQYLKV